MFKKLIKVIKDVDETKSSSNSSGTPKESELEQYTLHADAGEDGGLICNNDQLLKQQTDAIMQYLKTMGRSLLSGKLNLINTSFPVIMFEPRSYLEKLADVWVYPKYLSAAASTTDPLERMNYVVTWFTAGLHHAFENWRKPFNPLLGETWQATLSDGSEMFMEQISHHPPVSAFHIKGPGGAYAFRGLSEPTVSLDWRHKGFRTVAQGFRYIEFADGSSIEIFYPVYCIRSVAPPGRPRAEVEGQAVFVDTRNRIQAVVNFGALRSARSRILRRSDAVHGFVYDFKGRDELSYVRQSKQRKSATSGRNPQTTVASTAGVPDATSSSLLLPPTTSLAATSASSLAAAEGGLPKALLGDGMDAEDEEFDSASSEEDNEDGVGDWVGSLEDEVDLARDSRDNRSRRTLSRPSAASSTSSRSKPQEIPAVSISSADSASVSIPPASQSVAAASPSLDVGSLPGELRAALMLAAGEDGPSVSSSSSMMTMVNGRSGEEESKAGPLSTTSLLLGQSSAGDAGGPSVVVVGGALSQSGDDGLRANVKDGGGRGNDGNSGNVVGSSIAMTGSADIGSGSSNNIGANNSGKATSTAATASPTGASANTATSTTTNMNNVALNINISNNNNSSNSSGGGSSGSGNGSSFFGGALKQMGGMLSLKLPTMQSPTTYDAVPVPSEAYGTPLYGLEGSWLSHLVINQRRTWNISEKRDFWTPVSNPLPSDGRFREDIVALAAGDVKGAQRAKERLEVIQRGDKRLREEGREPASTSLAGGASGSSSSPLERSPSVPLSSTSAKPPPLLLRRENSQPIGKEDLDTARAVAAAVAISPSAASSGPVGSPKSSAANSSSAAPAVSGRDQQCSSSIPIPTGSPSTSSQAAAVLGAGVVGAGVVDEAEAAGAEMPLVIKEGPLPAVALLQ